ncbi:MAG: HEAT repeat domain-containing protein, partial [Candidatus Nanoarchaeia archaeon]
MEKSESENEWITQLQDKSSSHTRSSAAEALGKMKSRKAVDPLIAELKDEDDGVRRNAARALGLIGDVRAVDPLIALLRDKNCDVRKWIAEALVKLGWKPKDDEEKIWYFIAKKKWDECVKFGELAIEPLIASLKGWDEDISEGYESKVVLTLSKLGKPAVGPLIVALKDEDYYMRIRVITALGLIGDVRAVDPLIALLKDKDLSIRLHAAEALGKMKSRKAVDPLIAELKDEDDGVRRNAARALG